MHIFEKHLQNFNTVLVRGVIIWMTMHFLSEPMKAKGIPNNISIYKNKNNFNQNGMFRKKCPLGIKFNEKNKVEK